MAPHIMRPKALAEKLGFEGTDEFYSWLRSDKLKPFYEELYVSYYKAQQYVGMIRSVDIVPYCKSQLLGASTQYREANPDKSTWTHVDHYRRFVITMVLANRAEGGLWSHLGDAELDSMCTMALDVLRIIYNHQHVDRTGKLQSIIQNEFILPHGPPNFPRSPPPRLRAPTAQTATPPSDSSTPFGINEPGSHAQGSSTPQIPPDYIHTAGPVQAPLPLGFPDCYPAWYGVSPEVLSSVNHPQYLGERTTLGQSYRPVAGYLPTHPQSDDVNSAQSQRPLPVDPGSVQHRGLSSSGYPAWFYEPSPVTVRNPRLCQRCSRRLSDDDTPQFRDFDG